MSDEAQDLEDNQSRGNKLSKASGKPSTVNFIR